MQNALKIMVLAEWGMLNFAGRLLKSLLVGVCATSYYGGPLLVAGNYKVYRFTDQQQLNLNYENIEHLLY